MNTSPTADVIPLFPGQPNAIDLFQSKEGVSINLEDLADGAEINQMMVLINNTLLNLLIQCGYENPYDEITDKDFCFLMEAANSLLHRYHNREHPLQIIAEHSIDFGEGEDSEYEFNAPKIKVSVVDNE